ncbi:hypothetical protein RI129_008626 [Pyrocoelia pectoralis]|uniref:Fatty acid synthase n=1 Tax=Pyrocoelia pectoralis TaxID=417401 RepID=A0AAN7VA71_9COLE
MPAKTENVSAESLDEDEVVISGISGRFPECENVEEFKQKLFEGVDLVTADERRWTSKLYGLPTRMGKLKNLNQFDPAFFGIHSKQAHVMDPQGRILLEVTYESIVDAGYNPSELRGLRVGVFIAASDSETGEYWRRSPDRVTAYSVTGNSRTMLANRISYSFDFKGPSYNIDSACSSSLIALDRGFSAIKSGECDAAIVGGANLCLQPTSSLQYKRLNMLSEDGMCKAFDSTGKGYVRSEAACAILLQKSRNARRVYATVLGVNVNTDGYKDQGITFPSSELQKRVMKEVYDKVGINPASVVYVEAHGTGTQAGDPEELNAIADVFCKNRRDPLLLGSIKSNMGHPEPASGMCSIAKVIIAMESGIIPRNIHFTSPNTNIPALIDGRFKVVDQNKTWSGGLVGVNSFGFGGTNAHALLRSNPRAKITSITESIPRLVLVSGRTHNAVSKLLSGVEERKDDIELMALLNDIHAQSIVGHSFRGYQLLGKAYTQEITNTNSEKRPIWYVFSGMGSQWPQMAKELMVLEVFRNSIRRCADVLKVHGVNLEDVLVNYDATQLENPLYAFIGINAVQIALTDLLTAIGIKPDGIIGHSAGELGCAYADGCFTCEQTIMSAYVRGLAILNLKGPKGAMAAVGLSSDECRKRCPPEIFVACHNSKDNVTVSGPREIIDDFIVRLKSEGIFTKLVQSSGFAFHSKYVADAVPAIQKALDEIIPHPKPRSSKWISTSFPQSAWNTLTAQLCSTAYHISNVISPVLFYEAIQHIPKNAIVIEIAPHGLLQAILRRSLSNECINISLVKKDVPDKISFLLSVIGKIFNAGAQPKIASIYQQIQYPVGRGTSMINSLIEWDHSEEWTVVNYAEESSRSGEYVIDVDLSKDVDQYLNGHVLDDRVIFPASGYLIFVWKAFAQLKNQDFEQMPVVIENIEFRRPTIMLKEGAISFLVNILNGSGEFEICEGGSIVASGKISVPHDISKEFVNDFQSAIKSDSQLLDLTSNDIYKEFRLRGYDFEGPFKSIVSSDNHFLNGKIRCQRNWLINIDSLIQFIILGLKTRKLNPPVRIRRIVIDPNLHLGLIATNECLPVKMFPSTGIIQSGGIELHQLKANLAPRRRDLVPPKLELYKFISYDNTILTNDLGMGREEALTILTQIVLENTDAFKLKVVEMLQDPRKKHFLTLHIKNVIESEPRLSVNYTVIKLTETDTSELESNEIEVLPKNMVASFKANIHLAVMKETLSRRNLELMKTVIIALKPGGFILIEEQETLEGVDMIKTLGLQMIATQSVGMQTFVLLRKPLNSSNDLLVVRVSGKSFGWVESLKGALRKSELDGTKIYLVSQGEEFSGLVGMVNCLKKEPGGMNVRAYYIPSQEKEIFSLSSVLYQKQIEKDLIHNVLKNEAWGSYRHLPLEEFNERKANHAFVNIITKGDLSTLKWVEAPRFYDKLSETPSEICSVYYAPVNFKDVMLATGKLAIDAIPGEFGTQDCMLGLEFSGRDSKGRRVMGIAKSRGLALTCIAHPKFLWEVPEKWTLEEAATVPVVYGTGYYALIIRAQLQPGESVLIHSGAGGVGQAAISIALNMGCTVFTTVSNQSKRNFLKNTFPQLNDEHIGNSRDTSFEQLILNQTNGRGVDAVLNSLSGELLQASVRCLAVGGRFLEIGKVDLFDNSVLGMNTFLKDTSFHGILFDVIMEKDNYHTLHIIKLINEGIVSGAVRPLPTVVFEENQAEKAFRHMASGNHIGKVLLKIRSEENQKHVIPPAKFINCSPHVYMNPMKSYVLVGGLGGFGLELANWLICRGASILVLNSRNGVTTGYQSLCVRKWREDGVTIVISKTNVTTEEGSKALLTEALHLAPIGGIFNLAAVLRDAAMVDLSEDDFETVGLPKIQATRHLDVVSRTMAPHLDYFVVFSSISCGRGNLGQANYGFANSVMERICESRHADNLPGLAIQWGTIDDVGLVIEKMDNYSEDLFGLLPQRIKSCLNVMDKFLDQPHAILGSLVLKKIVELDTHIGVPEAVANILGIKHLNAVSPSATLSEVGMDSLMGSEIKQTLERNYDINLTVQEIRNLTFSKLSLLGDKLNNSNPSTFEKYVKSEEIKFTSLLYYVQLIITIIIYFPSALYSMVVMKSRDHNELHGKTLSNNEKIATNMEVNRLLSDELSYELIIRGLTLPSDATVANKRSTLRYAAF